MIRHSSALGLFLLAALLLLSGCADIDVRGRAIPAPVEEPEASEEAVSEEAMAEGAEESEGEASEAPEDLAFAESDPISPMTEVAPGQGGGVTLATAHVRTFGATQVDVGYEAPLRVQGGDRFAFTSANWAPNASIRVLLRPGSIELGTFTSMGDGSAFGFVILPAEIPDNARIQFVASANGLRQTDTIEISDQVTIGAGAGQALNSAVPCQLLVEIEASNTEIETVLAGATVDTTQDEIFWWSNYQAEVRAIGPRIDALRVLFGEAAEAAESPLKELIVEANANDTALLDSLRTMTAESNSREEFEAAVTAYREKPEVVALERDHAIFEVDEISVAECGFELASFKG